MKNTRSFCLAMVIQGALLIVASPWARAQDTPGSYVSRKEYEELKAEMLALKKELQSIKKEKEAVAPEMLALKKELQSIKKEKEAVAPKESATAQPSTDLAKAIAEPAVKEESALGTTKFLLSGWADGTFQARNGSTSTFSASFKPIFLWELNPRLLFEGQTKFDLTDSETDVELVYAQITYLLNDYIAFGAGEFKTPSNVFVERFQPLWIDKLPDRPLAVFNALLPESSVGVQVRGGFPIGPTRANYAFYVSNGPKLITKDPGAAGMLAFNNYTDNNDDKAVGGRVGFLPISGVEVGYGFETAKPGDQGTRFAHVRSLLESVDLEVTRDSDLLKGRIDLFAQYAWSKVDRAVYDPNGSLGFGPLAFTSKQDGGYAEIAYRPTKLDIDFVRNFEMVFRWDHLSRDPSGLGDPEETRWTLGIDYWLSPSTVVKAAYEWDQPHGEPNKNALLIQTAMGF